MSELSSVQRLLIETDVRFLHWRIRCLAPINEINLASNKSLAAIEVAELA